VYFKLSSDRKTAWILPKPRPNLTENVEQARAKLVQRSHPDALKVLSAEKRAAALLNAKRANAAYAVLARNRSQ